MRSAASSIPAAAGVGSTCANDSSFGWLIGTTWRCVCGTSSPTIRSPMRAGFQTRCCARPTHWPTWKRCAGEIGIEVDPMVDFGARDHERVTRHHRCDREEGDHAVVLPHEPPGQLARDDAAEDRRHGCSCRINGGPGCRHPRPRASRRRLVRTRFPHGSGPQSWTRRHRRLPVRRARRCSHRTPHP